MSLEIQQTFLIKLMLRSLFFKMQFNPLLDWTLLLENNHQNISIKSICSLILILQQILFVTLYKIVMLILIAQTWLLSVIMRLFQHPRIQESKHALKYQIQPLQMFMIEFHKMRPVLIFLIDTQSIRLILSLFKTKTQVCDRV